MTEQTGTAKGTKPLEHITVRIIAKDGRLRAVPNTAVVSIAEAEDIEWICQGARAFQIEFARSPFTGAQFTEGNPRSGRPNVAAGPTAYKYAVKVDGFPDLDPKVIIDA